jgi:hypothetical protein
MANEQLPWLTPFSQQDAPGFAWRSGGTESTELDFLFLWWETAPKEKQLPLRGTCQN